MRLVPILKACNQRCLFCSAADRGDDADLGRIFRALDAHAAAGAGTVAVSGGETTLSPDLFRIIARAHAKGLGVELQTNALTCAYPRQADRLAAAGVRLFNVNFPSNKSALNDRITGTKGTLELRVAGVRNLLARGARVRLTHLVTSLTYKDLPAFAAFVRKELPGVDYIQFSFIKMLGLAEKNAWLMPRYNDAAPYLRKALAACGRAGIEAVVDHIPPCFLGPFAGRHVDYIKLEDGGDVSESCKEKAKLPACAGCALAARCFGPRKDHAALPGRGPLAKPVKAAPGKPAKTRGRKKPRSRKAG